MRKARFLFSILFLLLLSCNIVSALELQVIYLVPTDMKSPTEKEVDFIVEIMNSVQEYFASEMDRFGFGSKTFLFDRDISIVHGKYSVEQYSILDRLEEEIPVYDFGDENNIHVVFVKGSTNIRGSGGLTFSSCAAGFPWENGDNLDLHKWCKHGVAMPLKTKHPLALTTAHEIGHSLGLTHQHGEPGSLMQGPFWEGAPLNAELFPLSKKSASLLNTHYGLVKRLNHSDPSTQEMNADVNNDGYVDLSDVMIVQSGVQNSVSYNTDLNNDGETNEVDVLIVKAKAMEAIIMAAPSKQRTRTTIWAELKRR